ncbi:DUF4013 domain-containing protein [uncultured Methanobrevibacter sp.]|uniref:DUF4013 domain-containing protein n=1 Tax=uncultured Methanobrevibacter sp. TaxID=253161 RepID=UPI0026315A9D|nr:DUF4013 domain-containing protein [uncultured Methanobrevibacter sp.]
MDAIEIIKDAFEFPSKNVKMLLIYELLAIVAGIFFVGGTAAYVLGVINPELFMWGGMAVILSMLIGWVLSGYLVSVIKSGIELDDEVPEFDWWQNFIIGFDNFIVSIVYFIIPAFIVVVAGYITNVYGNVMAVTQEAYLQMINIYLGNTVAFISEGLAQAIASLMMSLVATVTVAIVVFVIFLFLQTMAEARLANTGSLTEALNVFEAAKDIMRIGISKTIIVILLVIIIVAVIEMIFSFITGFLPILSILSIIITPYLIFFAQRAVGLLYSDIA